MATPLLTQVANPAPPYIGAITSGGGPPKLAYFSDNGGGGGGGLGGRGCCGVQKQGFKR